MVERPESSKNSIVDVNGGKLINFFNKKNINVNGEKLICKIEKEQKEKIEKKNFDVKMEEEK